MRCLCLKERKVQRQGMLENFAVGHSWAFIPWGIFFLSLGMHAHMYSECCTSGHRVGLWLTWIKKAASFQRFAGWCFSTALPKGRDPSSTGFSQLLEFFSSRDLISTHLTLWVISELVIIKSCNPFLISPQQDLSWPRTCACCMYTFQVFLPFSK